jgi:hypothetical protein
MACYLTDRIQGEFQLDHSATHSLTPLARTRSREAFEASLRLLLCLSASDARDQVDFMLDARCAEAHEARP